MRNKRETPMAKRTKRNFCPECGTAIRGRENFCSNCGNKTSKRRIGATKSRNWKWIAISVVAVVALITVVVAGKRSNEQKAVNVAHNTAQIGSIVSAFDCSCGQCDKTLANCDCPTAKDTIGYIGKLVGGGKYSRKEVVSMVNERYGHLISGSEAKGS
jgi:predicted nucleic acid-binding Zn ribbon protein